MKTDQNKLMDETFGHTNLEEPEVPKTPETPETPVTPEAPETPETTAEEEIGSLFANEGEETPEASETPETPEAPETPTELSDEEFDEIINTKERFQEFIADVRKQVMKEATAAFKAELNAAKEQMLSQIPVVVGKASEEAMQVKQETAKFFEAHSYLRDRRPYVRDMVARVSTENPDMTPAQVLAEVGKRAERDFSAYEKAQEREQQRKPTFAGAGGRRAPNGQVDNRTKQERLMDSTFG